LRRAETQAKHRKAPRSQRTLKATKH
jgi:hypothetical protein